MEQQNNLMLIQTVLQAIYVGVTGWGLFYAARQIGLLKNQVVLLSQQVSLSSDANINNYTFNKRLESQKVIYNYANEQNPKIRLFQATNLNNANEPISTVELKKIFEADKELEIHASLLLNFYESLSIGIQNGIYDENTIKTFFKTHVRKIFNYFKFYIEEMRATKRQPSLFNNFEALHNKWANETLTMNPPDQIIR